MAELIGTVGIIEAGKLLGVSHTTAYKLAREGKFPVPIVQVGHKKRVPLAPLQRLLDGEAKVETAQ